MSKPKVQMNFKAQMTKQGLLRSSPTGLPAMTDRGVTVQSISRLKAAPTQDKEKAHR
jgi:hypothetical protein